MVQMCPTKWEKTSNNLLVPISCHKLNNCHNFQTENFSSSSMLILFPTLVLFVGTFGFKGLVVLTRAVTHAHAHTHTHTHNRVLAITSQNTCLYIWLNILCSMAAEWKSCLPHNICAIFAGFTQHDNCAIATVFPASLVSEFTVQPITLLPHRHKR